MTDALDVEIHDQSEGLAGTDCDPPMEGLEAGVHQKDIMATGLELDRAQGCVPERMPVDANRGPRAHHNE